MTTMLPTLALVLAAGGPPAVVSTLRELGPALSACFQAPENSAGSTLTVRFSLDSTGAILGKPTVTYAKLIGSARDKQAFVEEALSSLGRCTPVHVSPTLGGAIAGRPMSVRFIGGGHAIAL